jgi:aminoglycoside phosphotransferase (APT) family kinase protein
VLVHGDLHDGNLLLPPTGRVGFIDLDLLHHGDPARDPGNLAAHVVLRTAEARLHAALGHERADAFVNAYLAAGGVASSAAVRAATARAAFRLACLYVFRRGGLAYADPLLRSVARGRAESET